MATRTTRYTDAQKAEALRLYRQGYSCRAAAQQTGVGFRAIAKWARQVGIIRKRSQRPSSSGGARRPTGQRPRRESTSGGKHDGS